MSKKSKIFLDKKIEELEDELFKLSNIRLMFYCNVCKGCNVCTKCEFFSVR